MSDNISAQQPKTLPIDYVGRIDENLLRIIVNIETPTGSTGTGFIINRAEKIFLVTNKHMIGDWSLVDPFIIHDFINIYFYPENPDSSIKYTYKLKENSGTIVKAVTLHPENDVDVAVVDISDVYTKNSKIARNYFSTGFLKKLEEVGTETNLGFGSQIFTIGYPAGFKFATSNYPVAKAGYIASQLHGKLEINASVKNRSGAVVEKKLSRKFFVVDGLIIGGNSGGPIISPKDFYYKVNSNHQLESLMFKSDNYIIGIVSFGWPGTGLTVIYPCDYILELINKL